MSDDGTWVPDGGRTEQSYWLTVRVGGGNGINNSGPETGSGVNSSNSMNQGDSVSLEEGEYMPSEDRSFAGGGYATASCDQSEKSNSNDFTFLLLLSLVILGRSRPVLKTLL